MSGSGAAKPYSDGPFQLVRTNDFPAQGAREGLWRVSWPSGSMVFGAWRKAMDWLDDSVAKNHISRDAIILAGPYAVPWLLEWYLVAAEEAEQDNREGVFDAYSKSAMLLLKQDSAHREALMEPWVTERQNRATS